MGETSKNQPQTGLPKQSPTVGGTKPPLLLAAGQNAMNVVRPMVSTVVSSTQAVAQNVAKIPNQAPKKMRWLVWVLIVVIAGLLIYGIWWFFATRGQKPADSKDIEKQTYQVLYRAANFPEGTVRVSGRQVFLDITNLDSLGVESAVYNLWLAQSGSSVQRKKVVDFRIDEDGIYSLDGEVMTAIELPSDSLTYDRWQVGISDPTTETTSPAVILEAENLITQPTNEFYFPVDLTTVGAEVTVEKNLSERTQTPDKLSAVFNPLPDLSSIGYQYEAWLVTFSGPTVTGQTSLGKFQGGDSRKTVTAQIPGNIDRYTTFVVSLEPISDSDEGISQIKPFSANF